MSRHVLSAPFYNFSKGLCADVCVVPVLGDNYSYILIDRKSRHAACVDPAEPEKVLKAASEINADLKMSLTTHHHYDHAGGNTSLSKIMGPDFPIYGSFLDNCEAATHKLTDKQKVTLGELSIEAILAPCHTKGHLLYHVTKSTESGNNGDNNDILFTGDTLFIGGCGKFFEGTGTDMNNNLNIKIGSELPGSCQLFCGHEYTLSNLKFAQHIEPNNTAIRDLAQKCKSLIEDDKPSVPSSIDQELQINPFMRFKSEELRKSAEEFAKKSIDNDNELMQIIRAMKDKFRSYI